jgi:hypothetical protein
MRMRFHVQGSHGSGTVHLEVQKGMTGTSYRYLFVEVAGAFLAALARMGNPLARLLCEFKPDEVPFCRQFE